MINKRNNVRGILNALGRKINEKSLSPIGQILSIIKFVGFRDLVSSLWAYIRFYGLKAFIKKVIYKIRQHQLDTLHQEPLNIPVLKDIENGCSIANVDHTVSIIVPVKNGGSDFLQLMIMLKSQKGFRGLEIIIVDSGSTDGSAEIARSLGAKVLYIPAEDFSHAHARNLGAENAIGDYLLFTVQDALPPDELWLYNLYQALVDPSVAAASCAEFPREYADLYCQISIWNHERFLGLNHGDRVSALPGVDDYLSLRRNAQLTDIACLIRKEVFLEYKFNLEYAEDLDLGIRLLKNGYRIAYLNSTSVIHSHLRTPYYFLKRGYVDNLALASIFPDFEKSMVGKIQSLNTISSSYPVICRLLHLFDEVDDQSVKLDLNALLIEIKIFLAKALQDKNREELEEVHERYLDNEYKNFLRSIIERDPSNQKPLDTGNILIRNLITLLEIIREYKGNSRNQIDRSIVDDVLQCIAKTYSYECGSYLARYYRFSPSSSEVITIHNKLKSGI